MDIINTSKREGNVEKVAVVADKSSLLAFDTSEPHSTSSPIGTGNGITIIRVQSCRAMIGSTQI